MRATRMAAWVSGRRLATVHLIRSAQPSVGCSATLRRHRLDRVLRGVGDPRFLDPRNMLGREGERTKGEPPGAERPSRPVRALPFATAPHRRGESAVRFVREEAASARELHFGEVATDQAGEFSRVWVARPRKRPDYAFAPECPLAQTNT